jgi:hypothetical protein
VARRSCRRPAAIRSSGSRSTERRKTTTGVRWSSSFGAEAPLG